MVGKFRLSGFYWHLFWAHFLQLFKKFGGHLKKASVGIKSPQVLTRLSILVENYLNYKMNKIKIHFDRNVNLKYFSALSVVISYS
jgi:hypothetical protein